MSTFEPMSEPALHEIAGNCATETSVLSRVVATALHHLARVAALEADLASAQGQLDDAIRRSHAFAPDSIALVMTGAARDIAGVERVCDLVSSRDDAQARVRELEAMTSTATIRDVHKALGAAPGESVVVRAQEVMAQRMGEWIAHPNAQTVLDILGIAAGDRTDPIGRIKALVRTEELANKASKHLANLVHDPTGDIEDLAKGAAKRIRYLNAEAEPAQTFHPPISVTIHHATGHTFAEIEVGDVTDPGFLALPMGTRLALVVTRD